MALAVFIGCLAQPVWAATDPQVSRLYEDALMRYEKKDMAGAIVQLKNALAVDNKNLSVQALLGKALLANKEVIAAEVALEEALRLGVNRAEIVVPLAQALLGQGKPQPLLDAQRFDTNGLLSSTALVLALGFAGNAAAQATWNFGALCDTPSCIASGVTATVTGFSAANSAVTYVTSPSGTVTNQGGAGLGYTGTTETTPGSPDHAFDNRAGQSGTTTGIEMLMIGFGTSKVALTAMATGWANSDSDVSVLRWDGAGVPTAAGTTLAGWTLISSKDVDGAATTAGSDVAAGSFVLSTGTLGVAAADLPKVSSWWMISTYFGASSGNLDNTANDFFKILSFTGNICTQTVTGGNGGNGGTCGGPGGATGVPEPTSLALLAAAALGGVATRRRWLKRG